MDGKTKATGFLVGAVALAMVGAGASLAVRLQGGGRTEPVPTLWDAPEFVLTDQTGGALARGDLAGTVWLASFVYTHCPDVCPLVTRRMAEIRDGLAAEGLLGSRVRLVSITVDPARDSPDVLRRYAAGFGADDPAHWAFLTGEPDALRSIIEDGFKLPAARVAPPGSTPDRRAGPGARGDADAGQDEAARGADREPGHDAAGGGAGHEVTDPGTDGGDGYTVMHSDRILLVDAAGRVRGAYSTSDPADQARLEQELRAVLRE